MSERIVLAADAGGTKTNLALLPVRGGGAVGPPLAVAGHRSADFPSLEAMIDAFLASNRKRLEGPIAAATVGFAGAVSGGRGEGTNVPWSVEAASLARHLGLSRVGLVNDLVATGYGVAALGAADLAPLLPGRADPDGNAAVLAAGTGLGEVLLARVGGDLVPVASEGGHADWGPRSDVDLEVWTAMRTRHGRVSVERVLSGPGLANVAEVVHARSGAAAPWDDHRREAAGGDDDLPSVVSRNGLSGSCPACAEALGAFVAIFGAEAGNVALRGLATAGVYLGGGIAPRLLEALRSEAFERAFRDMPPHVPLLATIPVWVILDDRTALWGAARHAARSLP
ncbi:MAG TPA: glucokinase [Acidobacteriota bacterium]|nr:glucokinase [Acidobacteriota bacterium]